jgi:hypothetical protein
MIKNQKRKNLTGKAWEPLDIHLCLFMHLLQNLGLEFRASHLLSTFVFLTLQFSYLIVRWCCLLFSASYTKNQELNLRNMEKRIFHLSGKNKGNKWIYDLFYSTTLLDSVTNFQSFTLCHLAFKSLLIRFCCHTSLSHFHSQWECSETFLIWEKGEGRWVTRI